jgi:valyl-tRNA synthetase
LEQVVLKVTPAHDINDKMLGDKHNLEVIIIFNEDASLNSFGFALPRSRPFCSSKSD